MKGPSDPSRSARLQQRLVEVDAAMRRSDMDEAARLADQATAEGLEHPGLLNLVASARFHEGRREEALVLLKRARTLAPADPHVLNGLGLCLKALGRFGEAKEAYDAALRADRNHAPASFNKGTLLEEENDPTGARACYERAAALQADYMEPLAALAWLAVQNGDAPEARLYGRKALALDPRHVVARMALAFADLQSRDFAAADALLAELRRDEGVSPQNRAIVLGLLGDLRDGQGRTAEAFSAYQACKAGLRTIYAPQFEQAGVPSALARVERLTAYFETASPEIWGHAPEARPRAADPARHVFLVGFPRSGTTLLENVLAGHPSVVSLEERDCLAPAIRDYLAPGGDIERLARIGSGEALRRRESYWAAVRSFGVEPRGRAFIDKMPLASLNLPLIAKLFPKAKVLFARRDPRDVVLSCFRRRFGMNPSMYQLTTLEGAAAYYAAAMRLVEIYRQRLPLDLHVVRYEDLVEDFDGTAGAACAFLGLEWSDGMRDFAGKARARGIATPSAAQVVRGLNREGQGAWRRYRDQMSSVLPLLQPWVEAFGYPAA